MLQPALLPRRLRGLVTDERGDSVHLTRGRHRIVDGSREHPWTPGSTVVQGRLLMSGPARVHVRGELRVTVAGHPRKRAQPKIEAVAAEVHVISGAPFVQLLCGARGLLYCGSRFEARSTAQAHLYDRASGCAYDEAVIFFEPGHAGQVLVLGHRVRLVPPRGRRLIETEAQSGYMVRLAEDGPVPALHYGADSSVRLITKQREETTATLTK